MSTGDSASGAAHRASIRPWWSRWGRPSLFARLTVVGLLTTLGLSLVVGLALSLLVERLVLAVLLEHGVEPSAANLGRWRAIVLLGLWAGLWSSLTVLLGAFHLTLRGALLHPGNRARELTRLAFYDPLSGLANRALFVNRLEHALERARRYHRSVAVLFLDLDNLKVVNDSLGHEIGDRLLVAVAERLRDSTRAEDTVARIGGDEFTVLLERGVDFDLATLLAERVARSLRAPVSLGGREIFPSASIGLALSVPGQDDPESLLRKADLAMYRAKAEGRARLTCFDDSMLDDERERRAQQADLQRAAERGELRLEYQPVVELATGRPRELEALLRWERPGRPAPEPAAVIALAESSGLIAPLGRWVLEQACRQASRWRADCPPGAAPVLSVNLSTRQLFQVGFVAELADLLREFGLPPAALRLELNESAVMEDAEQSAQALAQLRQLGVLLALDDFGTGYSALRYLDRLPVDTLKIDRSLVHGLHQDAHDSAVVESIAALARGLRLTICGEGIESVQQLQSLRALGCSLGQGYLFSPPLSAQATWALLAEPEPFGSLASKISAA